MNTKIIQEYIEHLFLKVENDISNIIDNTIEPDIKKEFDDIYNELVKDIHFLIHSASLSKEEVKDISSKINIKLKKIQKILSSSPITVLQQIAGIIWLFNGLILPMLKMLSKIL